MNINIIVAIDLNRGIAKDGKLPWFIPDEMAFFKQKTNNQLVIMGRKTANSLKHGKLLNRMNFVLTRKKKFETWDAYKFYFEDVNLAIESAKKYTERYGLEQIWVIGGLEIYKLFIPIADKIYMSVIQDEYDCDQFFPHLNLNIWDLKSRYSLSEKFKIYEYERKINVFS